MQVPVRYMNKLLSDWQRRACAPWRPRGPRTRRRSRKGPLRRSSAKPPRNPALNYAQREYRDEDFGDDFYINLGKYGEKGGERQ